ncbi:MAG: hypothetical protein HC840_27000 [Leptolyngbyaceae cyanobacterium RM2_2_4]|nr:hypothetical protein [Leptolyngbyaceae cyanobacterium RM2_2_4]
MEIFLVIDDLVSKAQMYNIPLLPLLPEQPDQPLTIFNLQDAVQTAVNILYHLRDEEEESYQAFNYKESIEIYGISLDGEINPVNSENLPGASSWRQSFRSDFLSRLSTYVMTVCNLDGILEKTYDKLLKALREKASEELKDKSFTLSPEDMKKIGKRKEERKEEIKYYSRLRNKVFAHTSYADPLKDPENLQLTSLEFYSGASMRFASDHVYIQIKPLLSGDNEQIELSIFGDYFKWYFHIMRNGQLCS